MLNTIDEALNDLKKGKAIIVIDDEDRENEGDFVIAARHATPEVVNFMSKYGRGLICVPLTEERAEELDLGMMTDQNTALHGTPFTISVDLIGQGCTTGISASDRSKTIQALADPNTQIKDLARPGHIFPLRAKKGGVLRRSGHTEAVVDLVRMAGFKPVGVLVEILKDDGGMARLPDLLTIAKKFDLRIVSVQDLIAYRIKNETLVKREISVKMPTEWGDFDMIAFTQIDTGEHHLALVKGQWEKDEPILLRVHSSCVTGDIFGSCRCDCGPQLHQAMQMIEKEGKGIILYMAQEGRGTGLINKLRAYGLQETGMDTVEANLQLGFKDDERDYGIGAQIIRQLGVSKMRLITNNPTKRTGLIGYGLQVIETLPIEVPSNKHNEFYLKTKRDKMGHTIMKKSSDSE